MQGEITQVRSFVIDTADEFTYKDPVDGSVAEHQGVRFLGRDGSRIMYRLSGGVLFIPCKQSWLVGTHSRVACWLTFQCFWAAHLGILTMS